MISHELNPATFRAALWLAIVAMHALLIFLISPLSSDEQVAQEPSPLDVHLLFEPGVMTEPPAVPVQFQPVTLRELAPPMFELPNEASSPQAVTTSVAPADSVPRVEHARVIADVAYIQPPQPRYPSESRRKGEAGLVLLQVSIDERGRVVTVTIERSSGYLRLDTAARVAVLNAKFRPYVENGIARPALAMIPIEFNWKARGARSTDSTG